MVRSKRTSKRQSTGKGEWWAHSRQRKWNKWLAYFSNNTVLCADAVWRCARACADRASARRGDGVPPWPAPRTYTCVVLLAVVACGMVPPTYASLSRARDHVLRSRLFLPLAIHLSLLYSCLLTLPVHAYHQEQLIEAASLSSCLGWQSRACWPVLGYCMHSWQHCTEMKQEKT